MAAVDDEPWPYRQSNVAGVHTIIKPFCFAATLVVLLAGCASNSSPTTGTDTYILHGTSGVAPVDSTSRPQRLTVGTSYSDTQLILPWFLNDIINFVNYR